MERCFSKPVLEAGTICIYRQPGSVTGRLVRVGQWRGGSVGMVAKGGAFIYHRLLPTDPVVGGYGGVCDSHLAPARRDEPCQIAAQFLVQLASDAALIADAALLRHRVPTLESTSGQVFTEVRVPSGPCGRWNVLVHECQVASIEGDDHVVALRGLACELERLAPGGLAGKGAA